MGEPRESEADAARKKVAEWYEKYQNRPIHRRLTREILDSTAADDLEQVVIDYVHT